MIKPQLLRSDAKQNPNPWLRWDCSVCWVSLGLVVLTILSFWTLDLQLSRLLSVDSLQRMGRFLGELLSPNIESKFLLKLASASLETLAMSALGSLIAVFFGLLLALPASRSLRKIRLAGVFLPDSF